MSETLHKTAITVVCLGEARVLTKITKASIPAGIVALLAAAPALAQELPYAYSQLPGPYVGLGVGAQKLEGLSVSGPLFGETSLNYNWGPLGTATAGWALGNGLRGEFEFGYRHSEAKNITLPSGAVTPTSLGLKENATTYSYMVNGLYDFNTGTQWIPHLGAGVGVANVRVNNIGHVSPFAFQAIGGVNYAFSPNLKLGVDYHFLGTDALDFKKNLPITSHSNYYDHAALVSVTYSFGAPPPPPRPVQPAPAAMAPPRPPPVPPPAPTPQAFTLYFDHNSTALSAEARQVVVQAANAARSGGVTHLNVVGHTDTSGAAKYNQKLSERRAEAVRAELIHDGVPGDEIAVSGRGESDLAVPTGNNVRTPQNRRVVIELQRPGA
jgi:OmpA-OmpF porin, OOP family